MHVTVTAVSNRGNGNRLGCGRAHDSQLAVHSRTRCPLHIQSALRSALAAALVTLTAGIAACGGDSTGPVLTPNLALHFDSLYVAAKALSAGDSTYDFRATALSDLELPSAFGAAPATIAVTTATGPESWKGFIFQEVMLHNGAPVDSGRFLLAYRDADAHTLIATVLTANGTLVGTSLLANDTLVVPASSTSGSITQTATGAACAAPPAALTNPVIATASQATCLLATYSATQSASFPQTAGVDPALTQLSFPLTTFAGARFQDPPGPLTARFSSAWSRAPLP
jgi:hypothetical protein